MADDMEVELFSIWKAYRLKGRECCTMVLHGSAACPGKVKRELSVQDGNKKKSHQESHWRVGGSFVAGPEGPL